MKTKICKWILLIFILFIACDDDNKDNNINGLELVEGTYYEVGHYYRYLEVVNSGNSIHVYLVADEPNSYCRFENRGELTANPSSGFVVDGKWYKFNPLDSWCGSSYRVVQQKDNNTIVVRSHYDNYESAYDLGSSITYEK